ncbi:MAG: serine/threonine protein kinase, partial [Actinomycetota bacterium]|nr:serine/threonine protein kinase [Actinomycetota bacterium]
MGAVWRARDELLNRDVAVKEINWPSQMDPDERETARLRAVREAQMAARLRHPNVVGVYDFFEEDDRPCIVMELVPYRSLREAIREDGPLSPADTARVGLGVLSALRATHDVGVLHRDVKPANILLGPEGQVVLTDFGIAKAADSPALTISGVLIGSPSYIAPERARGSRASEAADLWALGALLYTAVEGRPPFDREGVLASLTAVVADEPDPPVHAGPLWPVISGLLNKDPEVRLGPAETELMLSRVAEGRDAVSTAPWPSLEDVSGVAPGQPEPLAPAPAEPEPAEPEPLAAEPEPLAAAPAGREPVTAEVPERAEITADVPAPEVSEADHVEASEGAGQAEQAASPDGEPEASPVPAPARPVPP